MKISEIIGKELTDCRGAVCGYVRGVYALDGRIVYLACADCSEREFDADFRDITLRDGKLVFSDRRIRRGESRCLRLGMPAFTRSGAFAGYVRDIAIQNGAIRYYLIGRKRYSPSVLSVGDAAIIDEQMALKEDVIKDGKVILKKGTPLNGKTLSSAQREGEYIQARLKSI